MLVFPKSDPFVGLPDGVLPIKARLASMDYEPVKDILRSSPGDRVQQQRGRLVHWGGRLAAGYDLGHHPRHLRQPHRPGCQVQVLGKRPSRFASCQFCQTCQSFAKTLFNPFHNIVGVHANLYIWLVYFCSADDFYNMALHRSREAKVGFSRGL